LDCAVFSLLGSVERDHVTANVNSQNTCVRGLDSLRARF